MKKIIHSQSSNNIREKLMKNRRKRKQREEVRKILHTMRLELAAQRLAQERGMRKEGNVLHFNEVMSHANRLVAR